MPARAHSPEFLAVRSALLDAEDADRKPLARLFGAMQVPEADLTPAAIELLRTIVRLDGSDVIVSAGGFGATSTAGAASRAPQGTVSTPEPIEK